MNCTDCGVHVNLAPLYRTNPKGEPGIFKCIDCMDGKPDTGVKKICDIIAAGN